MQESYDAPTTLKYIFCFEFLKCIAITELYVHITDILEGAMMWENKLPPRHPHNGCNLQHSIPHKNKFLRTFCKSWLFQSLGLLIIIPESYDRYSDGKTLSTTHKLSKKKVLQVALALSNFKHIMTYSYFQYHLSLMLRCLFFVIFITCSICCRSTLYGAIKGDVNNNGTVDLQDTLVSLAVLSGRENSLAFDPDTDSSGDGKIGLQEALYSLRKSTEPLIKEAIIGVEDEHGIVVTISGSGFGARFEKNDPDAPFAPLLSSSFEYDSSGNATQVGQPAADYLAEWADRGAETRPPGFDRRALFSDMRRSSESTNKRSIIMTHKKNENGKADPVIVAQNLDFKTSHKIFFSYWVKYKWPNSNPDISYQFKLSTVVTDVSTGGHVPGGADMQLTSWMFPSDNGPYTGTYYRNTNGGSTGSNSIYFAKNTLEPDTDNWRHVVLFWDPGPADESKGKIWSWVSKGSDIPIIQKGGLYTYFDGQVPMISTYDDTISDFPNSIKLAWYVSKLSTWDVDVYFDDIVADNSWAQIFIGDKPEFDDCSQLELQQIVDWQVGKNGADDVAQFQLRYGSLLKDIPLYIYIINEKGLFSGRGFKAFAD